MNKAAILVAGGKGSRMGGPVAKQYLPIAGKPVLMHTLSLFFNLDSQIHLILVLPETDFEFWRSLCEANQFDVPHTLVAGGDSRFQSVKNGLNALPFNSGLVAIHDGVRPFVKPEVIENSFRMTENRLFRKDTIFGWFRRLRLFRSKKSRRHLKSSSCLNLPTMQPYMSIRVGR
jgi:2-C-methyl-D-erythritol 4-phosphate cytidylyltransferase